MKQSITIKVYPATAPTVPERRTTRIKPPIRMNNPHFQKGFYIGFQAALHDEVYPEEKMLSSDIVDTIKDLVNEGAFSTENDDDVQQIVGNVFGRIVACL